MSAILYHAPKPNIPVAEMASYGYLTLIVAEPERLGEVMIQQGGELRVQGIWQGDFCIIPDGSFELRQPEQGSVIQVPLYSTVQRMRAQREAEINWQEGNIQLGLDKWHGLPASHRR